MKNRAALSYLALLLWGVLIGVAARPAAPASILKGPYPIYPNDNTEMTVLWQLDATLSCTLEWGLDTSYSGGLRTSTEYGASHQHQVLLTGLTPGALYFYRLTVEASPYTGSFRTAPPADATNLEFVAYGDTRTNPNLHDSVCAAIVSAITADPDCQTFLLHAGDWVATGENENNWTNEYFNRSWANAIGLQAKIPIEGCMGNHEGAGNLFRKYWPYAFVANRYYSFDYGPAHVAVVDQYANYASGSAQLTWLNNDLRDSAKQWKFVLLHEPGWSAGGHVVNSLVQTAIQPLCQTYGVDVVLCGHNHYYARCDVNGIHHVTTGGGGAPLSAPDAGQPYVVASRQALHYCKIAIAGNDLVFQALDTSGSQIDTFSVNHPAPAPPSIPDAMGLSPSAITWTWQDNSANETSFSIYAGPGASAPGTRTTTALPDTQAWPETSLNANTQYSFQAASVYFSAESAKTPNLSRYTLARAPVAPNVTHPTANSLDVAIGAGDGNPGGTAYAIRISPAVGGGVWVQANGAVGGVAAYQTAAAWGTKTVTGLTGDTDYTFAVTGRNGDLVATTEGPGATGRTALPSAAVHGWRSFN